MSRELPSIVTPITYQGVVNSLILCWEKTGVNPTRAAVRLAAAQIAIESGLKSCRSYNVSGIKARPGGTHDWQFFNTREFYTLDQLHDAQAKGPLRVLAHHADGRTEVMLEGKHPYACFRAFTDLDSAMLDHLLTLRDKFPHGWAGLLTGDPAKFAEGLHLDHYYTAPQKDYRDGLSYRWREELKAVTDENLVWGDVA